MSGTVVSGLRARAIVGHSNRRRGRISFGDVCVVTSSNTHNSTTRVHRLTNVHNLVTGPSNSVVRAPVATGFHRNLGMLRCFVSARNTHGNLTSATLGATGSNCLAHHLISITRSLIIARSSYNARRNVVVAPIVRNNSIGRPLHSHMLNHMATRSILGPNATSVLIPHGALLRRR